MSGLDPLEILAYDKDIILYRPELNKLTGSVTATILLQQMIYWWSKNDRKKFYKFKNPPTSEELLQYYHKGDSWCEELGITSKVFDNAIKKIGFKLGKSKNIISKEEAYVIYYTDSSRLTWYELNEDKCIQIKILKQKDESHLTPSQLKYREYLQSPHWQKVRNEIIKVRGEKCEICGATENLQVHHKTYKHLGFEENYPEDLIVVCKKCHYKIHHRGKNALVQTSNSNLAR